MSHDDSAFAGEHDRPEGRICSALSMTTPTISRSSADDMLHHERVDFEAGMKVIPPVTLALMLALHRRVCPPALDRRSHQLDRVVATGAMDREMVLRGRSGG